MGDFRAVGGRNTNTFNCSPATIRTPASGSEAYLSPSATTTTAVITENAPCNSDSIYADAIGDRKRTNVLVRVNNSFGDRFSVTATANYSHLRGVYRYGPAGINKAIGRTSCRERVCKKG